MKKLLVLLMAFSFFVASCNNNKNGKDQNTNNRDKDDYGKNENINTGDENKTNTNFGNNGWPGGDRNKFLQECVASFEEDQVTLAGQICPCLLNKMEKKYASYTEADARAGVEEIKSLTVQCKDEVSGNNGNNNNSIASGWSRNDVYEFVTNCVSGSIKQGMGQEISQKYCSCMQQKLEQMFPDPKNAGNITAEQMSTPEMLAMAKSCLTGD